MNACQEGPPECNAVERGGGKGVKCLSNLLGKRDDHHHDSTQIEAPKFPYLNKKKRGRRGGGGRLF